MQKNYIRQQKKKEYAIAMMICFICMAAVICGVTALSKKAGDVAKETEEVVDLNETKPTSSGKTNENSKTKEEHVNEKKEDNKGNNEQVVNGKVDGGDREGSFGEGATDQINNQANNQVNSQVNSQVISQGNNQTTDKTTGQTIGEAKEPLTDKAPEAVNGTVEKSTAKAPQETQAPVSPADSLTFSRDDNVMWPVEGEVIMEYSMDKTIYFKTLDSYKCNPAIIIQAEPGTKVIAGVKGYVENVGQDSEIGNYVELNIGSGFKITYGQIDAINVTKGSVIEQGETLGIVAAPSTYYTKEGANVYMKMTKDGEPVNPIDYLE